MVEVKVVTVLPLASSTVTTGSVESKAPGAPATGWVLNTSWLAGPTMTLKLTVPEVKLVVPSLAWIETDPRVEPDSTSVATPLLRLGVVKPVTAPEPPNWEKAMGSELFDNTVLPLASSSVAVTVQVWIWVMSAAQPLSTSWVAGPATVGEMKLLITEF